MRNERGRAWRRGQADRKVAQRITEWKDTHRCNWAGPAPRVLDEPGRLRKWVGTFNCNCRKKARGRPGVGGGICHGMMVSPIRLIRIDGQRVCQDWLDSIRGGLDQLDIDPEARTPWIERTW